MIPNKEKYVDILGKYFGPFTAIPTEEEQLLIQDGKMSLKEVKEPYRASMFREWLDLFAENERMSTAILYLRNTLDGRTKKDQEELIGHVLVACFLASHYKEFNANVPEYMREQHQVGLDKLESVLKDINNLQSSISNLKISLNPHIVSQNPFDIEKHSVPHLLTPEEYQIVSHFVEPYDPKISDPYLSFKKFGKVLRTFQKLVKYAYEGLGESTSPERLSYYFCETGPLKYPKKLSSSQHLHNPELNGLIFYLALLFRQYTASHHKGEWLVTKTGAMPKTGKPCHKINADFVNATFPDAKRKVNKKSTSRDLQDDPSMDKEFNETHISQKLHDLINNGAEFTNW
jgi:hypothetical protein